MLLQRIKGTLVKLRSRSRTINARLPCPQCHCRRAVLWPTRPLSDRRPGAPGAMRVTTTQRPFFTSRGLGKLDVTLVPLCWMLQGGGTARMSKNKRTLPQTVHTAGIATFCCDVFFFFLSLSQLFFFGFCDCHSVAKLWCLGALALPSVQVVRLPCPLSFSPPLLSACVLRLASELQLHSGEKRAMFILVCCD